MKNIVLGAGIAGIASAFELKKNLFNSVILEKNNNWGGLLDNFVIQGFRFDKFVHFSFSNNEYVNEIFFQTKFIAHEPISYNRYNKHWLKHPAQNNLFPLEEEEKEKILKDFKNREDKNISDIANYEEWLRVQYGNYFAENFPMIYTEKYWTVRAKDLETKWVGNRMYKPTLEEVEEGCKTDKTPNTYYTKEMRYPEKGGYKSFLEPMVKDLDIRVNSCVNKIDIDRKEITLTDGSIYYYDNLISSLPLTEICKLIENVPDFVLQACDRLNYTSGYLISLGFNKKEIADKLWFYIYDKNILTSRVYSPSMKSPDNAPEGCSSFQAEIYYNKGNKKSLTDLQILDQTINDFIKMGLFDEEDLVVRDIRCEKYANVVFDHNIYENRKVVLDFLRDSKIISVGRFGEWDYFWSDQSLISGRDGARELMANIKKNN